MGTRQKPDRYDPKNVPATEPVFTLRAQDKIAPALVDLWADLAEANGCPKKKVAAARRCAAKMRKWKKRKLPD